MNELYGADRDELDRAARELLLELESSAHRSAAEETERAVSTSYAESRVIYETAESDSSDELSALLRQQDIARRCFDCGFQIY